MNDITKTSNKTKAQNLVWSLSEDIIEDGGRINNKIYVGMIQSFALLAVVDVLEKIEAKLPRVQPLDGEAK